jgi:hypothetical protein
MRCHGQVVLCHGATHTLQKSQQLAVTMIAAPPAPATAASMFCLASNACPVNWLWCCGACVGGSVATCYNDLWVLDLEAASWSKPDVCSALPSPRAGHSGALVGGLWYILGGGNNIQGGAGAGAGQRAQLRQQCHVSQLCSANSMLSC